MWVLVIHSDALLVYKKVFVELEMIVLVTFDLLTYGLMAEWSCTPIYDVVWNELYSEIHVHRGHFHELDTWDGSKCCFSLNHR